MPGTSHPRTAHSEARPAAHRSTDRRPTDLGDQELCAKAPSGSGYTESAGPTPAPAPTVFSLDDGAVARGGA